MPTQNILIEFTASAEGLNVGIDALLRLGKIDQETADKFTKANDALKQRQILLQGNETALTKFIGSLTNAQKAAVGDTYSKTLTQIKTQLASVNVEAKEFYTEIARNATAHIIPGTSQEELLAALTVLGSANQSLKEFGGQEDVVAQKTVRATTQLREMRQELLVLEESGSGFSQKFGLSFDQLSVKAAKLQDRIGDTSARIQQMSSDTFPLQAIVGSLTGVAAGFNVASGAAILFGGNQEEVQQAILKVQGAMQVLNGLESISALIADQSVAKTGLQVLVKKLFTKTTQEEVVAVQAESESHIENAAALAIEDAARLKAIAAIEAENAAKAAAPATQVLGKAAAPITQVLEAAPATGALAIDTAAVTANTVATEANVVAKGEQAAVVSVEGTALVGETIATEGATVAQVALNTAMELNPLGIVLAAILALTVGFATYKLTIGRISEEEDKRNRILEATVEAEKKAADGIAKEEGQLNILLITAKNKNLTDQERQSALDKITSTYPEYLSSLSLDNIYTKQSAGLIQNQIKLIKEKAFVQAAQDLYTEKLKKVVEAEANLNRIRTQGADIGDKIAASFSKEGDAILTKTVDQIAEERAIRLVEEANKDAEISVIALTGGIENVSKQMRGGADSTQAFTDNINELTAAALHLPKEIKVAVTPFKPFNPEDFDKTKKAALDAANYRVEVAKKGSQEEFNARVALTNIEHKFTQDDVRILAEDKKAEYGKYLDSIQGLDAEARAKYFKDTIAASQAIVLQQEALGREGSEAFFNARRDVLIKTAKEARSQEGITAGEIKQINAQLNLDIINLDLERAAKKLDIQKILTQELLNLSKEGSQEELNAQIALLEIQKQEEINAAKENATVIQEINDRYLRLQFEKIQAFNQKVKQDTINSQISVTNDKINQLKLEGEKDTDASMLELKKQLIEQQGELEIASLPISGLTEERRREIINGIYSKELVDKKALEDAKAQVEIDAFVKSEQIALETKKLSIDAESSSAPAFGAERKKINNDILQNELDNIQVLKDANRFSFEHTLIDYEEFSNKNKDLDNKKTKVELDNIDKVQKAREAAITAYADVLGRGLSIVFDKEKQQLEESAANNKALLDKKLISQDEFNKRQKKIKQDEAKLEKQKALVEIAIDFAKQFFFIKAQVAVLLANPLTSPLALGALAQLGLIVASYVEALSKIGGQKLKAGKVNIDGIGTETSDSIPARISRHESVINAFSTLATTTLNTNSKTVKIKNEDILTAINENRLSQFLLNVIPNNNDHQIVLNTTNNQYIINNEGKTINIKNGDLLTAINEQHFADLLISNIKNGDVITAVNNHSFSDFLLSIIPEFKTPNIILNVPSLINNKYIIKNESINNSPETILNTNGKIINIKDGDVLTAISEHHFSDLLINIFSQFDMPEVVFNIPELKNINTVIKSISPVIKNVNKNQSDTTNSNINSNATNSITTIKNTSGKTINIKNGDVLSAVNENNFADFMMNIIPEFINPNIKNISQVADNSLSQLNYKVSNTSKSINEYLSNIINAATNNNIKYVSKSSLQEYLSNASYNDFATTNNNQLLNIIPKFETPEFKTPEFKTPDIILNTPSLINNKYIIKNESVNNSHYTTLSTNGKTINIKNGDVLTAISEHHFADLLISVFSEFDMPEVVFNIPELKAVNEKSTTENYSAVHKNSNQHNISNANRTTTIKNASGKTISIKNGDVLNAISENNFADFMMNIIPEFINPAISQLKITNNESYKVSNVNKSINEYLSNNAATNSNIKYLSNDAYDDFVTTNNNKFKNNFSDYIMNAISEFVNNENKNINHVSNASKIINEYLPNIINDVNNNNIKSISESNLQNLFYEYLSNAAYNNSYSNIYNDFVSANSTDLSSQFKTYNEYLLSSIPKLDMPDFVTESFSLPVMNDLPKWVDRHIAHESYTTNNEHYTDIDYERLGKEVGKHFNKALEKAPGVEIGFDHDGMVAFIKEKSEMEKYVNRRRGFKN